MSGLAPGVSAHVFQTREFPRFVVFESPLGKNDSSEVAVNPAMVITVVPFEELGNRAQCDIGFAYSEGDSDNINAGGIAVLGTLREVIAKLQGSE